MINKNNNNFYFIFEHERKRTDKIKKKTLSVNYIKNI